MLPENTSEKKIINTIKKPPTFFKLLGAFLQVQII